MTLSACLIVRDEEAALGRCLASFRQHVDELVVVDTGSKDGTREIARAHGARLLECPPTTHPHLFLRDDEKTSGPGPYTQAMILADFAAARNLGWDAARGDYLVWFDADDVVTGAEHLRSIASEMERDGVAVGLLPYVYGRNAAGEVTLQQWRERIVRRGAGRWQGAIHETIATIGATRNFDQVVVEHRREPKPGGVVHRNYKVLRQVLAREGAHPTPRTLFYLGNEARHFDHVEALSWLERFLGLWTWSCERTIAFVLAGRIHEEQGRASGLYDPAFRAYAAATVESPQLPDGWFGLARVAYHYARWGDCVAWTERGLALGDPDEGGPWSNPGWWERGWERRGEPHVYYNVALARLGRTRDAAASCRAGLAVWPENEMLRQNLAHYTEPARPAARPVSGRPSLRLVRTPPEKDVLPGGAGRKYAVTVVELPGFGHNETVRDVADGLAEALRSLGHDVATTSDFRMRGRQHIVLNAMWLPSMRAEPLPGSILYNLEQVYDGSRVLTPDVLSLYRRHVVWDYCPPNVEALARLGIRAQLVPIGWSPALERVPAAEQDIDVLFYGELSPRRLAVRDAIEARGLTAHFVCGVYGAERDALIARSKVCVNIHSFDVNPIFEAARVTYLVGNGKAVVSEHVNDPAVEMAFGDAVAFTTYDDLADRCAELARDAADRRSRGEAGRRLMRARPQAAYLADALGLSPDRNLVIGAAGGYSFSDLAPFVESLRAVYHGDLVLLDYGLSATTRRELEARGVDIAPVADPSPLAEVNQHRYGAAAAFLRGVVDQYDRVLLTDVRDVVFQVDPFSIRGPGLCAFAESGRIGDDACNASWVRDLYGPAMLQRLRGEIILCSGTTLGPAAAVLGYLERMTKELQERRGSALWGRDQGVHNVLLRTEPPAGLSIIPNGQGVFTLALVAPSAVWLDEGNRVVTEDGQVIPVLHQYDRHPLLAKLLRSRQQPGGLSG